jgi:hypothetical protein
MTDHRSEDTKMTAADFNLRKCPGHNPDYDVIENTSSGGHRIGSVYPNSDGGWSGSCSYAVANGHVYQGNLCGNYPAVRFESKDDAGAAVYNEKVRRNSIFIGESR